MHPLVNVLKKYNKFNNILNNIENNQFPINLSGLFESQKAHLAFGINFLTKKKALIITYNEIQAKKLYKDLSFFSKENIELFPKKDVILFDIDVESKENAIERLRILNTIKTKSEYLIITTIEAIMQKMPTAVELFDGAIELEINKAENVQKIIEKLVNFGYERCEMIEGAGQFAIRGGIIDIFPLNTKLPVRVEFFGNEIETIRTFDISTQRSIENVNKIRVLAEKECGNNASFVDYFDKDCLIFVDEYSRIKQKCDNVNFEYQETVKTLIEKGKEINKENPYYEFYNVESKLQKTNLIMMEHLSSLNLHANRNDYSFSCREATFFRDIIHAPLQELQKIRDDGKIIVILISQEQKAKKFVNTLLEQGLDAFYIDDFNYKLKENNIYVMQGFLSTNYEIDDFNLVVLSDENSENNKERNVIRKSTVFKNAEKIVFADLNVGDFVVHVNHGIGKYIGINTLELEGIKKDFIKIQYEDNGILYVPTNQLDAIRKYIGGTDKAPKLNKLGSKDWLRVKSKVKESLKNIAKGLIELYSKRKNARGYQFSTDTDWQKQFEDNFQYQETDDQLKAIEEVKQDMEKPQPMDRLLCGDVGYGKTEVAIRAAFKAVVEGKQVAYLVPTTILANQQYNHFRERMQNFGIKVEMLSRFRTPAQQSEILKKLMTGEINIIIGTHRIIQKDIQFKDLGLLIIDEEQRFGVGHKEKIKELKTNVDVLTMTATPIPRTLHMSIVGIRDLSVIHQPPQNRRPIHTYVLEYDEIVIQEAIIKEIERDGQVFYLYNRVDNIDKVANKIQELVPDARVTYAHGKMTPKELENIMMRFIKKEFDVIVCTTILETGIDIANANTLIIEDADKFGLSQLYQIRGRVGRSERQAYAYFTYQKDKILSEDAEKRLKAIKEFTEFGSGFKIAMRDLEIRGGGNILGAEQSGHMEAVGYEMYCKLLEDAVKELNGTQVEEEKNIAKIDLNVNAYIKESYIWDPNQKIDMYQKIAYATTEDDATAIMEELRDRFGKIPEDVINLINIARLRHKADLLNIESITQKQENVVITRKENIGKETMKKILDKFKNRIFYSIGVKPYITFRIYDDVIAETMELLSIIEQSEKI